MIMVILNSIHFELFVELRHTKAPYIYFYCITLAVYLISIHAPMKGATFSYLIGWNDVIISIHAPMKGATQYGDLTQQIESVFQSTHP